MKKKGSNFLLIGILIAIWGIIIFRVASSLKTDDDEITTVNNIRKVTGEDYSIRHDTTHLSMNYHNPFEAIVLDTTDHQFRPKVSHLVRTIQTTPAVNWQMITYNGYIRNSQTKRLIAVLTIGGRQLMMAEGQTAENVKLLRNMRDSIKILRSGRTGVISLKQ